MAFLVMNRDAEVARERLLDLFWPDAEPDRARDSLRTALSSIRRCVTTAGANPEDLLHTSNTIVRWVGDTAADSVQFAAFAARTDADASRAALDLYHGDFLEGDYDQWAVRERERLAALYELVLARAATVSGDAQAARRLIERNPYNEDAYAALIEADLAEGRRSSAGAWIERCRTALSQIGEQPSAAFETRFGSVTTIEVSLRDELALPFAGREDELANLAASVRNAANGHGSLTLVYGEAGIGKSALLVRATRIAAENGLRVLTVRCGGEAPSSFGPWPALFRVVTGLAFDEFIATHTGDLIAAVAHAMTVHFSEPTALVVDDAHELTAESLEIFIALAQEAMSKHAIVVGLRTEGLSTVRSRFAGLPVEELPIRPLDRNHLQWALAQALGTAQPRVLEVLYSRTGGHPFFFAGLLNSLVTTGVLARGWDGWKLAKSLDGDIELPDSVKRFIEVRLASRGEIARTVACALALEPAANADDLTAVLSMDELSVLNALDDLLALDLIAQPDSGPQFAFGHELIREVAAVGLNAGRRAVLHRAFARRLEASHELETPLRLARHLCAAGEFLSGAQAYHKSAEEALRLHATQDAVERCQAGILAAEKLEPTIARDILLSLRTKAALAAVAGGDTAEAIAHAKAAAALARESGNVREYAEAALTLATVEGAALHAAEQQADAIEAAENARLCSDAPLQAQALVQQARAARELGLRNEALQASHSARSLALECGRADIAQAALEESLHTQVTWWLFGDALNSAQAGLEMARRSQSLMEATFLQARSMLWYLLERFEEAQADVRAALQNRYATPPLRFACHYMAAKLAVAQKNWDKAIESGNEAARALNVSKLPRRAEAVRLLRIDVLLQRNSPGDSEAAHELAASLVPTPSPGTVAWSDCVELARARYSARMRRPDTPALLRRALNAVEENAHRAPLDTDRAFARLAEACSEADEQELTNRASARSAYYRSLRCIAAGANWGGGSR
jgi:DNA-binding SARP family transcriptional activator/predicted ATPase